jgi:hypothetical protein
MGEMTPELSAKLSLINLIRQADKYEFFAPALRGWFEQESSQDAAFTAYLDSCHTSNVRLINEWIHQLGGLAVTVKATETIPEHSLTLHAWHGIDQDDPDMHSWVVTGEGGVGVASLKRETVDEIYDKLLDDFDADV